MFPLGVEIFHEHFLDQETLHFNYANDILLIDSETPSALFFWLHENSFLSCFSKALLIAYPKRRNIKEHYKNERKNLLDCRLSPSEFHYFVLNAKSNEKTNPLQMVSLSLREMFVFRDSLQGVKACEISKKYGISPKTVYAHRRNACIKIGIRKVHDFVNFSSSVYSAERLPQAGAPKIHRSVYPFLNRDGKITEEGKEYISDNHQKQRNHG